MYDVCVYLVEMKQKGKFLPTGCLSKCVYKQIYGCSKEQEHTNKDYKYTKNKSSKKKTRDQKKKRRKFEINKYKKNQM